MPMGRKHPSIRGCKMPSPQKWRCWWSTLEPKRHIKMTSLISAYVRNLKPWLLIFGSSSSETLMIKYTVELQKLDLAIVVKINFYPKGHSTLRPITSVWKIWTNHSSDTVHTIVCPGFFETDVSEIKGYFFVKSMHYLLTCAHIPFL